MPDDHDSNDGSDDAAIDPRYDPAFQRGYSGKVISAIRGSVALQRSATVDPAPGPARERVEDFRPIMPGTVEDVVPSGGVDLESSSPPGSAPVVPPLETHGPVRGAIVSPHELARNPFVIASAAIAVFLIVAGAVWVAQGFASIIKNGGTRNEVEFWAAQTMSFGAPLAIVVGFAVTAVLLALFARAWQRARG